MKLTIGNISLKTKLQLINERRYGNTGIGDFEERDSGNNHLNEPRTGMSVEENL